MFRFPRSPDNAVISQNSGLSYLILTTTARPQLSFIACDSPQEVVDGCMVGILLPIKQGLLEISLTLF